MEGKKEETKVENKSKRCTLGWNWGHYELTNEGFMFKVNNAEWFTLPYKSISVANPNGKNEVAIELTHDPKQLEKADVLTELRFFIPNPDVGDEDEDNEEVKKTSDDVDEDPSVDVGKTPSQILANKIIKKSGLGEYAGQIICTISDIPMLTPRGKYNLEIYETFLKFHGRTHDYKILYKDVNRAFLLPMPDSLHIVYVVALNNPVRQGQTQHHYLIMQFSKESTTSIKLNLSPEDIQTRYTDLAQEIDGQYYDVVSRVFKSILKIAIIVPSGFKSADMKEALKCSIKAQEGYLYPLRKSLFFIHKPVSYIKHSDIQHWEFARVTEFAAHSSKSFDWTVVTKKGDCVTYSGLEKQEYNLFIDYLKSRNIKIKNIEAQVDPNAEGEDDDQDSAGNSDKGAEGFYNEDDDEDFVVEGEEDLSSDSGEGELDEEHDSEEEEPKKKTKKDNAKKDNKKEAKKDIKTKSSDKKNKNKE